MESRRIRSHNNKEKRTQVRRTIRLLFILLFFIIILFILIQIMSNETVNAPEQEINEETVTDFQKEKHEEIETEPEEVPEQEPEFTQEEIQAMEEERVKQKLFAFEQSYYIEEKAKEMIQDSEWILLPDSIAQGDVLLVRHNEEGEITWNDKTYLLKPFGLGYYTYLPIPVDMKAGEYEIGDQILTIQEKSFETQYLEVSKKMESMRRDTQRISADQQKINLARKESEAEFLFSSDSEFVIPVEGRLSTPFGYTRYVNGSLSGRHRAIDLAAPEGTPIQATNDGIVVLAEELYLTGNAIYIDHGMGLFSQYAHLFELNVKVGDRVKQGDIIGLVGSTGFSTGPHLHFTFWAHNVPVNPDLFFGKTPFHWFEGE
jgi:biotin carboxyl carrier protein